MVDVLRNLISYSTEDRPPLQGRFMAAAKWAGSGLSVRVSNDLALHHVHHELSYSGSMIRNALEVLADECQVVRDGTPSAKTKQSPLMPGS